MGSSVKAIEIFSYVKSIYIYIIDNLGLNYLFSSGYKYCKSHMNNESLSN